MDDDGPYIYIYIYIKKETGETKIIWYQTSWWFEGDRIKYIYIYIYIAREGERERETSLT